ncbi:MAG: sensor histidine kinase, partial [Anaerococcus obesiensis]
VSYIVIVIDNSKNKKAEAMRREFSSNVSHELKSPLTSINGYAELIATGLAKDDDIKKFGQIINEEGNRLLNIIDDILKLSKLDEENLQEGKTIVNIKNVVDESINRFKRISEMKNIKVENKVCDINIKTHESLFTDLVTNIYENAIKYNKTDGQIIIKCEKNKKNIKLIIEDRGIGIKKEDLPRIFERFYVTDKQRTRTLKSTGLGLSIVKHICDYLNYDIKVESKYGYGSKFIISIPAL